MRYAIVGAGLAGLTCAYEIARQDDQAAIEVFEAAGRIGGKLYTVPFSGGPVDVGAEAFIARHAAARDFFTELGLEDSVVYPSGARSLLYTGGQLKDMPGATVMGVPGSSAAVAHLVSAEPAARIDAEGDAEPIDWTVGGDTNLGALVRQRYGDEVADRLVAALLGGVYSCSADDLGVRATIPQLAAALDELAQEGTPVTLSGAVGRILSHRPAPTPGAKPAPIFGTFKEGYQELYETLAQRSGADIYVDAFVSGIGRDKDGRFTLTGAGEGAYDRLILATPAPTTALLLGTLGAAGEDAAGRAGAAMKSIKLASCALVTMKFDSDAGLPENSGVLVAADEPGVHAKAFTLSSRKWPHLGERGGALVRASFGRFGDDSLVRAEEDTLVDYALDDLQHITGFDGRAANPAEIFVQRWFGALPRYDEHHLDTVATVRAALADVPGLEATGAWAGGVGVPAVIVDARATAARAAAAGSGAEAGPAEGK